MNKQDLKALADSLPPLLFMRETKTGETTIVYTNVKEIGEKILRLHPDAVDQHGIPLQKDKKYFIKIPTNVNHFKQLKKLKTDHDIDQYCKNVRELARNRKNTYIKNSFELI